MEGVATVLISLVAFFVLPGQLLLSNLKETTADAGLNRLPLDDSLAHGGRANPGRSSAYCRKRGLWCAPYPRSSVCCFCEGRQDVGMRFLHTAALALVLTTSPAQRSS